MVYGYRVAKEVGRFDVGQSIVVRGGVALAIEAMEGTDACIRRGGELGHGGVVVVKVSKPGQDLRFDVPAVGPRTIISPTSPANTAAPARTTLTSVGSSDFPADPSLRSASWGESVATCDAASVKP